MAPGALEQAYITQAGAGLIAIELKSGKIAHQSPSFQDPAGWIPVEARGNIRVFLESRDGDDFHSFCQSVVKDAGEPYGENFQDRDKVVGAAHGAGSQAHAGPAAASESCPDSRGDRGVHGGFERRDAGAVEVTGGARSVFAGFGGGIWHLRHMNPLAVIVTLFNFKFSKKEGGGASVFSRAAARLEHAATSALDIAPRSASWLTRKVLSFTDQWTMHLQDDDTVSL
jgi:hypothetical protein